MITDKQKADDRINVELERQAVATVFEDNILADDLIETCNANYFVDKLARMTFKWIHKQYMKSKKISIIKIKTETEIDIQKIIDSGIQVMEYSEILYQLKKLYIRREIAKSAKEIYQLTKKNDLDIEEYEYKAQELIYNKTQQNERDEGLYELEESLDEVYKKITYLQEGKEEALSGMKTGYPQIDKKTAGLKKGHLVVIGASTSMGKTAFALSLTYKLIKRSRKGLIISVEMNHDEISQRLLSLDSRVPVSAYDRFGLTEGQKKNMDASFSRLMDMKLTISDKRGMRVEDIRARCRKVSRDKDGLDFIVIDYLQRIPIPGGNKNTAQKIGEIVNRLRDMAGELDCPVILISQLRRYNSKLPSINYLRNSGEIEEVADDIWLLHRKNYEEEYKNDNEGGEEGKVIIAKGRTSGTEICDFSWYPEILYWQDNIDLHNGQQINIIK